MAVRRMLVVVWLGVTAVAPAATPSPLTQAKYPAHW
jgi:hypothetical protein